MLLSIFTLDTTEKSHNKLKTLELRNKSIKGIIFDTYKVENMVIL